MKSESSRSIRTHKCLQLKCHHIPQPGTPSTVATQRQVLASDASPKNGFRQFLQSRSDDRCNAAPEHLSSRCDWQFERRRNLGLASQAIACRRFATYSCEPQTCWDPCIGIRIEIAFDLEELEAMIG